MFEVPGSGQPTGTVVQVLEAGYTIHDRLLRPALVGIAKAEAAPSGGNGTAPTTNGSGEPAA
jgi:molecular chaperone GrpE